MDISLESKACQVLVILENPTSKSLPKSSQEINKCISMDEDHVPYQVLAQVTWRCFKLTKNIEIIKESHFLFINDWNHKAINSCTWNLSRQP